MKHSIFILVFLMASFCLSAQTPQKRVKKSQSTDVSDVNNAADTGGVSKNIAVTDNSMNKNVTNASSSSDNGTGNNQLKRKKFMARPGDSPPIPINKRKRTAQKNDTIIKDK